jgi:hypothetical protein
VLFEPRLQKGLSDGSIRVAFRRWMRAQVVVGRNYRSPIGMVTVDSVTPITDSAISPDDARLARYASPQHLLADLKGPSEGSEAFLRAIRSASDSA